MTELFKIYSQITQVNGKRKDPLKTPQQQQTDPSSNMVATPTTPKQRAWKSLLKH